METASRSLMKGKKAYGVKDVCSGDRNIWCPEYNNCLTRAAIGNTKMNCWDCRLKNMKMDVFVLTMAEIQGCKALVNAIFQVDSYDAFL